MAIPSAQTVWATYQANAGAAGPKYLAGVESTTKDPTALAAAAAPKWFQKLTEAYQQGRFQAGLAKVGKQGWIQAVKDKGAANFVTGVNAAETKFLASFTKLLAYEAQAQQQIASMPNVTSADGDQRMLAWKHLMEAYVA